MMEVGFGGGCHWCTEAMFVFLKGVNSVKQGFISSTNSNHAFSEAVIVSFDEQIIPLKTLIHIHLLTHQSTKNHSFRNKYRSAIYYYRKDQKLSCELYLKELKTEFKEPIITQILSFIDFKSSQPEFLNYYGKGTEKPFCKSYIEPKLKLLLQFFSKEIQQEKVAHLKES